MNQREFFDTQAETWDEKITKDDYDKISCILKMVDIQNKERILDVGCGTGVLLPFLKRMTGEERCVIALDFSLQMLKKAKVKFKGSFRYIQADVHQLPFKEKIFDKVICFNSFAHFKDRPEVLTQIFRVLKVKGNFIIAHSANRKEINNLHKEIGSPVENDRIPKDETMISLFKKAGFTNIRIINKEDFYFAKAKRE